MTGLAAHAKTLRELHRPGDPLLLPNAWDAATARLVAEAGFPVVATTSHSISQSLGFADGEQTPAVQMLAAVRRIARAVDLPVTADLESGYGLAADELVAGLLEAGVVGLNFEDTDHGNGGLRDPAAQAVRIAGIREAAEAAGVPVVINARVDVFHDTTEDGPTREQFTDGVERAKRYRDAGADCVYPILLADRAMIGEFVTAVDCPVNVTLRAIAPPPAELAELGVARISLATGLMRAAQEAVRARLAELR
ncbi:isocitrate lyase/phosphoenolpyruvate mutase family protein [Kutzneria viridogrisea]|uniref:2-methylisocitrate lyase-like PEP mutase family enzyme n=1 Tax=Kutzneria viridogrisea TaxID=47990 RepID=A0ABR6BUA5_9PSEU|nr:2-methylisocitrate lyase-like PEP mutase family enzyme [Kutzneria viridogrisea]